MLWTCMSLCLRFNERAMSLNNAAAAKTEERTKYFNRLSLFSDPAITL